MTTSTMVLYVAAFVAYFVGVATVVCCLHAWTTQLSSDERQTTSKTPLHDKFSTEAKHHNMSLRDAIRKAYHKHRGTA